MVRLCEHNFLTVIGLLPISLSRDKEIGERKRVQRGLCPLVDPPASRVTRKKRSAFFAKHTRLSQSADFAFAASKRTAKTEGISTGRNAVEIYAVLPLASS